MKRQTLPVLLLGLSAFSGDRALYEKIRTEGRIKVDQSGVESPAGDETIDRCGRRGVFRSIDA